MLVTVSAEDRSPPTALTAVFARNGIWIASRDGHRVMSQPNVRGLTADPRNMTPDGTVRVGGLMTVERTARSNESAPTSLLGAEAPLLQAGAPRARAALPGQPHCPRAKLRALPVGVL